MLKGDPIPTAPNFGDAVQRSGYGPPELETHAYQLTQIKQLPPHDCKQLSPGVGTGVSLLQEPCLQEQGRRWGTPLPSCVLGGLLFNESAAWHSFAAVAGLS
eukprot:evm.model.scf_1458.1 EVM.evm.TU.scf_1458.1   scf_1458:7274-7579(-)